MTVVPVVVTQSFALSNVRYVLASDVDVNMAPRLDRAM
jgi:hypothetical protein